MAYYEGRTLREKIEQGPLPVEEAVGLVRQLAEGLAAAHEKGIVHRDIKPSNILVTDKDIAKIVDFGIAKVAGAALTKTGTTMGTVAYMSPEQTRGETVLFPEESFFPAFFPGPRLPRRRFRRAISNSWMSANSRYTEVKRT